MKRAVFASESKPITDLGAYPVQVPLNLQLPESLHCHSQISVKNEDSYSCLSHLLCVDLPKNIPVYGMCAAVGDWSRQVNIASQGGLDIGQRDLSFQCLLDVIWCDSCTGVRGSIVEFHHVSHQMHLLHDSKHMS